MISRKTVTIRANDQHLGMTFDEVVAFVGYARTSGAHGTESVKVSANFRQGIKSLTIDISGEGAPE